MPKTKRNRSTYGAAAKAFARARRALLAPHHGTEDRGFEEAFGECEYGLRLLEDQESEPGTSQTINTIRRALDVADFSKGPWIESLWLAKIRRMPIQDKELFAQAVDDLADRLMLKHFEES